MDYLRGTKGIYFFSNKIKPEDNATIKNVHSIAGAQTSKVPSSETKSRQMENDRSLSASSKGNLSPVHILHWVNLSGKVRKADRHNVRYRLGNALYRYNVLDLCRPRHLRQP